MAGEAAKKPEIPILAQVRPPHIRKDGPKPRDGCPNQIEAQNALGPLLRRTRGPDATLEGNPADHTLIESRRAPTHQTRELEPRPDRLPPLEEARSKDSRACCPRGDDAVAMTLQATLASRRGRASGNSGRQPYLVHWRGGRPSRFIG